MLSLLGSVLGFGTSIVPKVFDMIQDGKDKKHEIELMREQREIAKAAGAIKLQQTHVEADIREQEALMEHSAQLQERASPFIRNLAASVRPCITYLIFIEFAVLTLCVSMGWMTAEQYQMIWNNEFQAVYAGIISFWFGSRTMARKAQT
tara:strand:- start:39775 stop:40221 length:447 start_codon:yes stop_codon:yes gene_type:complete